ncbi:hypothetical protein Nans01_10020 [Nocardiopsis ansamitocini]|uniref:Uncharacterized protein n=1 Tax=Nocardiopsis ansamitocini TaxID=1670832 RepID=A0A9W6UG63_9ACTN|nr:hypothetical protein Nans01_10020 [Nocardiopsis ansamitocini]
MGSACELRRNRSLDRDGAGAGQDARPHQKSSARLRLRFEKPRIDPLIRLTIVSDLKVLRPGTSRAPERHGVPGPGHTRLEGPTP